MRSKFNFDPEANLVIYLSLFCPQADWINAFNAMKQLGSDGVILWGSSYDLDTE